MKSIIIAALIGAVTAFTPAKVRMAPTQLSASAALEFGAQQPLGFFDPIFGKDNAGSEPVAGFGESKLQRPSSELNSLSIPHGYGADRPSFGDVVDQAVEPVIAFGMKVVSSIGSLQGRSKTCQIVRRRGRIYMIDRKDPRNKVRQGGAKQKKRYVKKNKKRKYKS